MIPFTTVSCILLNWLSAFTDHFSQFQIQLTEYTARVNVIEQGGDGQNLIVGENKRRHT